MSIRRGLKNLVTNFSEEERDVREATANEPGPANQTTLARIADRVDNPVQFARVMEAIYKRLTDTRVWRHVDKSLALLHYLVCAGGPHVAECVKANLLDELHGLEDFHHYDSTGRDQGLNIRSRANKLLEVLDNEEILAKERDRALSQRISIHESFPESRSRGGEHDVLSRLASPQPQHARADATGAAEDQQMLELAISMSAMDQMQRMQEEEEHEMQLALALSASVDAEGTVHPAAVHDEVAAVDFLKAQETASEKLASDSHVLTFGATAALLQSPVYDNLGLATPASDAPVPVLSPTYDNLDQATPMSDAPQSLLSPAYDNLGKSTPMSETPASVYDNTGLQSPPYSEDGSSGMSSVGQGVSVCRRDNRDGSRDWVTFDDVSSGTSSLKVTPAPAAMGVTVAPKMRGTNPFLDD